LSAAAEMPAADGRAADGGGVDRLAQVVFALLVIACFAAFIITQRLKHTPTPVQHFQLTPRFSPTPAGHIKQERIAFKLDRADEVTVTIVNGAGDTVATLVRERPVPRYKQISLRWNGRMGSPHGYTVVVSADGTTIVTPRNTGALAPAGEYRVHVALRSQHRTVPGPRTFTLVGT
jgi:hypothetical protein